MIKVSPLFSGSKGNCTLIQTESTNILLDAGFRFNAIVRELEQRGLSQKNIDAIIITHEHTDHIGALPMWTKKCPTLIYAPSMIADYVRQRSYCSEVNEIDGSFVVGDIAVDVYECSHDAICCYGYRFTHDGSQFACVTDTGCVTDELVNFLAPCRTVMLESNHDLDMLKRGEYSYQLKRRILSDFGHLSNVQAAQILQKLIGSSVKNVILAHLSEKNNTKELAFATAVQMYSSCGLVEGKDVFVYVAEQYKNEVIL